MPILVSPDSGEVLGWGTPGNGLGPVSASLGDVMFGTTDNMGCEWVLESIEGWWNSPPTTGSVEQRAFDHGGWLSPSHLAPRTIEIVGSVNGPWAAVSEALDRLHLAVPVDSLATLYVAHEPSQRVHTADVRQNGDILVERYPNDAEFSISLIAPDPRRYDVDSTTVSTRLPTTSGGLSLPVTMPVTIGASVDSGVLSATNEGNFATRPTLTVEGPVEPFTITHKGTGQTLRYHESIPSGRSLVIDVDKRSALLDGTTPRRVTGQWFEYAPGLNEVAFMSQTYDAAALLTSTHRHAWR